MCSLIDTNLPFVIHNNQSDTHASFDSSVNGNWSTIFLLPPSSQTSWHHSCWAHFLWQLTNTFWFQLLAIISFDKNQKFSIKIIRFFFFKSFISTISHFHFHSRWIGWERVPIETTLANVNGSYWPSTWSWTWTPLGESRLHYSSDWLSPHLLRLLLRLWQISDFCCIFLSDISGTTCQFSVVLDISCHISKV